ncbi:MAG: hypothetical protein HZA90_03390 [Verrucomicrobia bacterium]|nr:hypothetical protein [Verrucomicrobiota bacterium]
MQTIQSLLRPLRVVASLCAVLGTPLPGWTAGDLIWIEGEQPTKINQPIKQEGVGHPEFLSQQAWLKVAIDADKVDKDAPADGVLIDYAFEVASAAEHEVWARIGFEFARSPFDWRLDGGEWRSVSPEVLTTDLMELSFWTEVAWLKLGKPALSQGAHTLSFRLPNAKDAKGKPQRILFALDCICVSAGEFHPYSHFKPGEDHQTEADRAAAKQMFQMPEAKADGARVLLKLNGTWEVCRHDEEMPGEVAAPIKDFPAEPRWTAIAVPIDKNDRPDLVFAHRLWYRTRVEVPASLAGRSFFLVFPQNNLNTTVFVNGQFCGFDKNPFARVQIDLGRAMKPGLNEIRVGIKDAWYGYSASPTSPLKLRKRFNLPKSFFGQGFQDLAYPIWNHPQSGILVTPELVAAGPTYLSDVFVKPSVAKKELTAELMLKNPGSQEAAGEVLCEAVNAKTGGVEKRFAPQPFKLAAGQEEVVKLAEPWSNPKLWWPDDPNLYTLRVTLTANLKSEISNLKSDLSETSFGFREWGANGKDFTLNGVPWHVWADCFTAPDKEAWLKFYRDQHQTVMRFWGTKWQGLPPEEALSFFDQHGVLCRRSGILDGEAIGYMAIENDPELKKLHGSDIKMELMKHWQDQMVAQVRGERNHPSVMLWSIENEWLYINCINLYGGLMDKFEAAVLNVSDAVRAADPTRLTMTDGGGAGKANVLPVHGDHYVWDAKMAGYPDLAYDANPTGGGRGRWVWDAERPRFLGEDYFIAGHHPELAYLGGEAVFGGKAASLPAAGLMARILTEGYRWAGFGGFHFWMGQSDTDGAHYRSFAPRAVFCRQWDWTFGSGQAVKRSFGILNDTHSAEPLAFTWTLSFGGRKIAGETKEYRVASGTSEKFDVPVTMPKVDARTEGELALALTVGGQEVFRDAKAVSVLNVAADARRLTSESESGKRKAESGNDRSLPTLTATDLLVLDPRGSVTSFLSSLGQPFTALCSLETLPASAKVLLVASDALSETESTSTRLAAWASASRAVVVLEQTSPLRFQALPCEMEPAQNEGRVAFAEDLGHPAFRDLQQKDFFTWGPDSVVYRNAYLKPTRGAKSLVQCDDQLRHSALVEVPCGKGVLLLSQLAIGRKLASNAVAQAVLHNLIGYAGAYQQEFRPVAAAVPADAPLARVLEASGLKYSPASGPLDALSTGKIAVIAATPASLKTLAASAAQVKQFTAGGGWIVFNGLTPEGLADFNQLVGVDHVIRPFRRERVTFPPVRNHLTAGLTVGDVALYSSERIFPWQAGNYVASDTFSYCVDYDEVAPFAKMPSDAFDNMVNGMVSADGWKYIFSFELKQGDKPEWTMEFPAEQEFIEWTWIGNGFYHFVTKVEVNFDGQATAAFDTLPNTDAQTFAIDPPRRARKLRLKITDWQRVPNKNDVVGVDNLYFKARRSPEFYAKVKPMLNVGALMEYPQGQGGIVLCNVNYQPTEPVPANGPKKQAILTTILRNLKAPFAGKTVIAGANLRCAPIDLSKHANAFRDEKGWFGDAKYTFKDLPTGRQTLAGVEFDIFEFATSPVPTALMLSEKASQPAKEIRGIPVNRKADALFFLHTMKLDQRMNDDDRRRKRSFETLRYVVTYADGKSETVPILAEIDIHEYRQKTPLAIPGAQVAWTKKYDGTDNSAVAYAKQWNNPRPDVEIKSIDMLPGEKPRGVPALLAVTAAVAE